MLYQLPPAIWHCLQTLNFFVRVFIVIVIVDVDVVVGVVGVVVRSLCQLLTNNSQPKNLIN